MTRVFTFTSIIYSFYLSSSNAYLSSLNRKADRTTRHHLQKNNQLPSSGGWNPHAAGDDESKAPPADASSNTEWKTAVILDSGERYYYNTITRETQWETPMGFSLDDDEHNGHSVDTSLQQQAPSMLIEKAAVDAVDSYLESLNYAGGAALAHSTTSSSSYSGPKENYLPYGAKRVSVLSTAMSNYLNALSNPAGSSVMNDKSATTASSEEFSAVEAENSALKVEVAGLKEEIALLEQQLAMKSQECQESLDLAETYNELVVKTMAVLEQEQQQNKKPRRSYQEVYARDEYISGETNLVY